MNIERLTLVKGILTILASALLSAIMALVYMSVFIWNVSSIAQPMVENPYVSGSPFTLAQVMAIFGAFGAVAGFSDRVEVTLKRAMRRVAILHFVSALCFCLLGLLLPALPYAKEGTASFWIIIVSLLISIGAAALSFSWGTIEWLYNICSIVENKETCRCRPEACLGDSRAGTCPQQGE